MTKSLDITRQAEIYRWDEFIQSREFKIGWQEVENQYEIFKQRAQMREDFERRTLEQALYRTRSKRKQWKPPQGSPHQSVLITYPKRKTYANRPSQLPRLLQYSSDVMRRVPPIFDRMYQPEKTERVNPFNPYEDFKKWSEFEADIQEAERTEKMLYIQTRSICEDMVHSMRQTQIPIDLEFGRSRIHWIYGGGWLAPIEKDYLLHQWRSFAKKHSAEFVDLGSDDNKIYKANIIAREGTKRKFYKRLRH